MMDIALKQPPVLFGDERQQLAQLRSYLYQMQQQLQVALEGMSEERIAALAARKVLGESPMPDGGAATLHDAYRALKALIIKTADTVSQSMQELNTTLRGELVANATFGTYQEQVRSDIRATATDIVQSYQYDSRLQALQNAQNDNAGGIAALQNYNISTEQYIKTGLLFYDANNVPRYGVAVGEKLTDVIVNGQLKRQGGACATFTSDKLSFWQNDMEVAYISNNQLCINEAKILTRLFIGDWVIDQSYGFAIKWAGV